MDIEVFDAGVLLKILAQEGEEVPAGRPIAIIGKEAGEDIAKLLEEFEKLKRRAGERRTRPRSKRRTTTLRRRARIAKEPANGKPAAPAPEEQGEAASREVARSAEVAAAHPGAARAEWSGPSSGRVDGQAHRCRTHGSAGSLRARRSAWSARLPSPARSRGRRASTSRACRAPARTGASRASTSRPGSRASSDGATADRARADEKMRITQMRKSIAKRLTAVHTTAPTFFLTAVFECDNLVQLRTQLVAAGHEGVVQRHPHQGVREGARASRRR